MEIRKNIFGFEFYSPRLYKKITKNLSSVPKNHLKDLIKISFYVNFYIICYFKNEALYYIEDKIIKLYTLDPSTLYHEIGHHVWYNFMNNETKAAFFYILYADIEAFKKYVLCNDPSEEWFADEYANYILKKQCSAHAITNFMKERIMNI